jgi:two-component system sensor histidine kinase YesM
MESWNIAVMAAMICIYVATLAGFRIYLKKYREKERQLWEKEKTQIQEEFMSSVLSRQMQYDALQSQINPHFLYNTLDSIRGEAMMAGNGTIADMTEHLSRFFRYCISNQGNIVTIRDEINNTFDYFYIQKYRFGNKFRLETSIEETCYNNKIPKMTLQPIVENAIFHGLERKKEGGTVHITIFETEKNVKITVSDDGVGIEEETLRRMNVNLRNMESGPVLSSPDGKKTGIALQNVNERIRLCYGRDYGITLRSTKYLGTDVIIVIPKEKEEERF